MPHTPEHKKKKEEEKVEEKIEEKVFLGPVRPETDEEFFRKTGISRPKAEIKEPPFIRGEGDKAKGFVKIGKSFFNIEQFTKPEKEALKRQGVQFPPDVEQIQREEAVRLEEEGIRKGVQRDIGEIEKERKQEIIAETRDVETTAREISEYDRVTALVEAKYPDMPKREIGESQEDWFKRYNEWRLKELGGYHDPRGEFRKVFSEENLRITADTFFLAHFGSANIGGALKTLKTLNPKAVKTLLQGAGALSGADVLVTWLASDNIISSTPFSARLIRESYKDGVLTKEQALREIDEDIASLEAAESFVKLSTSYNPILVPFQNSYLINARKNKRDVLLIRDSIEFGE